MQPRRADGDAIERRGRVDEPRRRRRADYTNGANKDARCASGGRSDESKGGHRSSQSLHFGVKFAIAGSVNDARPACFWSRAYRHLAAQLCGGDAKDLRWRTYCHHQSWAHLWPPHLKSTSSDSRYAACFWQCLPGQNQGLRGNQPVSQVIFASTASESVVEPSTPSTRRVPRFSLSESYLGTAAL